MAVIKELCILTPLEDYFCFSSFDASRLPDLVSASGIKGRGWTAFPAAEKWKMFAEAEGSEKEIICLISGDCAFSLMECNPSAVLVGVALTAKAFGISHVYMVSDRIVQIPEQFLGVEFIPFTIEHTLSSGEETKVIAAIEEDTPISRLEPPYPAEKGLFGRPTLFHSAEFFAHIPYICNGNNADTKLVKVCGGENTGVVEIMTGTPISEILALAGCGSAKAVQLGGPTGVFLPSKDFVKTYTPGEIFTGDSSIRIIPAGSCMAQEVFRCVSEAYRSSCGKCVFCREGGYQQYLIWKDIVSGKGLSADIRSIRTMARVMHGNAACGYGQSLGGMIESAMESFSDEIVQHIEQKKCPELVCPTMIKVYIAPDKCKGCGSCTTLCPEKAIAGGEGLIHVVNHDLCIGCLKCNACPEGAVGRISAKGLLPSLPENPIPVGTFVPKKKGLQRRAK